MSEYRAAPIIAILGLATGLSCSDSATDRVDHPFAPSLHATAVTEVSRIGDGHVDFMPEPVCKLAAWGTGGAGVFVVERIVLVDERADGEETRFVYIELGVEEAWEPADLGTHLVVRAPDSWTTGWDLNNGDRVVAFLRGHESMNAGFPWTTATRMYRPSADDGWLVHSDDYETATLRDAVRVAYASFLPGEFSATECGLDVDFDRCPVSSMIPEEHFAFDEPCQE